MKKYRVVPRLVSLGLLIAALPATAQQKQPNILVIWGDDIGRDNIIDLCINNVMH